MRKTLMGVTKTAVAAAVGYTVASAVAGSVNGMTPERPNEYIHRREATDAGMCGALAAVLAVGLFNRLTRRFVR